MTVLRPDWQKQAKCAGGHPSDVDFFSENYTPNGKGTNARAYCNGTYHPEEQACPVITLCGQYAKDTRTEYGTWGGLPPPQRRTDRADHDKTGQLRKWRNQTGLTQTEVAERFWLQGKQTQRANSGSAKKVISQYETGLRRPTLEYVKWIKQQATKGKTT